MVCISFYAAKSVPRALFVRLETMEKRSPSKQPLHFSTVYLHSVPRGRRGKHNEIVGKILEDLDALEDGTALRIPLESFGEQKLANVRAAVSRATKQRKIPIASSSDSRYFYLWFEPSTDGNGSSDGTGKRRKKK